MLSTANRFTSRPQSGRRVLKIAAAKATVDSHVLTQRTRLGSHPICPTAYRRQGNPSVNRRHPLPHVDAKPADMQRIAVTGASGLLGQELCRQLGDRAIPLHRSDLDLTDFHQIREKIPQLGADALINAAGYTAVDLAEEHPTACRKLNGDAVQVLAETTTQVDCRLIQVSSDYVFGQSPPAKLTPWTEEDVPAPRGTYARSKRVGEQAAALNQDHLIVRTCGLYGDSSNRSNSDFVTRMLQLGRASEQVSVVDDQICSPTWVVPLASALCHLTLSDETGIFHVVNQGSISWFEFARAIFRLSQIDCDVHPVTTAQFGAKAPRPTYSVLDNAKYLATNGPRLASWDLRLQNFCGAMPFGTTNSHQQAGSFVVSSASVNKYCE